MIICQEQEQKVLADIRIFSVYNSQHVDYNRKRDTLQAGWANYEGVAGRVPGIILMKGQCQMMQKRRQAPFQGRTPFS